MSRKFKFPENLPRMTALYLTVRYSGTLWSVTAILRQKLRVTQLVLLNVLSTCLFQNAFCCTCQRAYFKTPSVATYLNFV